jgi:hypothetical protein
MIKQDNLHRFFNKQGEIAWIKFGVQGFKLYIETPSDWHEQKRFWFYWSLGLISGGFSLPWYGQVVPDHYQCSGPRYGFNFFSDLLFVYYGKDTGRRSSSKSKAFSMPWSWGSCVEHKILSEKESHPFTYVLKNGTIQNRTATIYSEYGKWTRYWIPWEQEHTTIWVEFDDEVGERSGSWKGGITGTGYEMLPNETPLDALRRMEKERKL